MTQRHMAHVQGPVVTFLIGMRIRAFWRIWEWLPVMLAMPAMQRELATRKELGLLGTRTYVSGRVILLVQYWQSFAQLEQYARDPAHAHLPAWRKFNQRARRSAGAVGIFHETYTVGPGSVESIYVDMPESFGLAGAVGQRGGSAAHPGARERLAAVAQ